MFQQTARLVEIKVIKTFRAMLMGMLNNNWTVAGIKSGLALEC